MKSEFWLYFAAGACFIAALLHIAVVIGGPDWYRFFGAGEGMAHLAEKGSLRPTLITLFISAVLMVFALYSLSAADTIIKLPLLKLGLVVITGIFLVRGILGLALPFLSTHPAITQNSVTFWMISSLICTAIGLSFLMGTWRSWENL